MMPAQKSLLLRNAVFIDMGGKRLFLHRAKTPARPSDRPQPVIPIDGEGSKKDFSLRSK
jgi:hypothetical protein